MKSPIPGQVITDPWQVPTRLGPEVGVLLGWGGCPLPVLRLLGRRVVVFAELIPEVHQARTQSGWGPVTDRATVGMWDWPEMADQVPEPAVRITGVVAVGRHWWTTIAAGSAFTGVCPVAVLLPPTAAREPRCGELGGQLGMTVAAAAADRTGVDIIRTGRTTSPQRNWTWSMRWVHELVYQHHQASRSP